MRIVHNFKIIKKSTISGRILKTVFKNGEKRGDCIKRFSKSKEFFLVSGNEPAFFLSFPEPLRSDDTFLYVWGQFPEYDNKKISITFISIEEAQKALGYINEFNYKQ